MTMQKVQRLEDIGRLPDNWNGYGARERIIVWRAAVLI